MLRHTRMYAHSVPLRNQKVRCQPDDSWAFVTHPAYMGGEASRFGETLRDARKAAGLTQQEVADAASTSKSYVSDLERGARSIPPGNMLERLAAAVGVEPHQLLGSGAAKVNAATVPVVGYVQAGAEAILYAEGQGPFDMVTAPPKATPQTVALQSRGESLGPLLAEWLVFYDDVRSPITPDLHGELCVLGLPDGRVVVKQLKPARDGLFHLISQNEGPMLDQQVEWGARVTAMMPR